MKILTVIGARPQFIKAAPVQAALQRHGDIHHILVHTGQHDEMVAIASPRLVAAACRQEACLMWLGTTARNTNLVCSPRD